MLIKRVVGIPTAYVESEPTAIDAPIANLYCPALEWEETARKIAKIREARFTIVCPSIYRDEHFPNGVHIARVHSILLDGKDCICGARLDSFEIVQIRALRDRQLKGVLGVQFVNRILDWFNTSKFADMIGAKNPRPSAISYDDNFDIAKFCVVVLETDTDTSAE